ncbi:Periplasmic component of amino acid ABC-type transporter/signal transduction system precursor [Bosea sp. LC85]|uniref:transporter substrate-binding domain-containing protein n=1 Tax=Bosea sp. LC85 TaxID=1502851 RepID=UPI0004E3738E|nr:transporter substrate-binding domain-containing protein [Bosea sp. LC85]KFC75708.1 Periplasmic component of amino acid ABC-type transporter/signal transduction system precursor [Bosea sp. LC85]
MRSLFAGLAALTVAVFGGAEARADKLQDILSKGVVRIGVPLDAPPFGAQDENRKPVGFDIEMAEMVAKGLGVKLEMQQITGANRIPFLLTDKVDIVISVMGLTPERAKQIQFTAPYANTFLAVYGAKASAVSSPETIGSARVAAAKGTTQELAISATAPKASLMRTEDDATAAAAYITGQADLLATNSIVAQALAKQNPNKEFERKFVIRRSPAHMGVQMDQHNLVRWLDGFIFFNSMNGEIDRLHRKYLDMPMDPLPTL